MCLVKGRGRATSAAGSLEVVFAAANLSENLNRIDSFHTNGVLQTRPVGPEEGIGRAFQSDRGRQSRKSFCPGGRDLDGPTLQIDIVGFDRDGKMGIGLGVFMTAID